MGCAASSIEHHVIDQGNKIDDDLARERENYKKEFKLLLLGTGESGKSTIVKQIRIIHEDGYTPGERKKYISIVHSNTLQSLFAIMHGMKKLEIEFTDESRYQDLEMITTITKTSSEQNITSEIGETMTRLWCDVGVQRCFSRSREYQLNDSAAYFLNDLSRISTPQYIPTEEDILKTRVRTTGVVEAPFFYKNQTFKMVDVGGQRSERKKWYRCFHGVTAIIFCTSLSEYDLVLEEDEQENRMVESMKLFDSVCQNKWLTDSSMILFLNKKDLFKEKIGKSPLNICFPEYEGLNNYEQGVLYIQGKFEDINRSRRQHEVYTHPTCATNTQNIQNVHSII